MAEKKISEILRQKGIYITNTRIKVYKIMLEQKGTINASQIQKLTLFQLDRISIYRALKIFLKKGLIYRIPNSKGWPKYLVKNVHEEQNHPLNGMKAVHFICRVCGTVKTTKTIKQFPELMPVGYTIDNCEVIMEGKCDNCR